MLTKTLNSYFESFKNGWIVDGHIVKPRAHVLDVILWDGGHKIVLLLFDVLDCQRLESKARYYMMSKPLMIETDVSFIMRSLLKISTLIVDRQSDRKKRNRGVYTMF